MKKQKKENNLVKENEKMNRQPVALSDEMLEQVSGGDIDRFIFCETDCGKPNKCYGCPFAQ